ncbi:MAG: OsmC family protein [Candidatus Zixiibacteriota bacterium]
MGTTPVIEADVVWEGGMAFAARTDSHHFLTLDASPEDGGQNSGPRPMEMVACALGGCTAMDVVAFLQKKRRTVESMNVHVTGRRAASEPAVFKEVILEYRLRGPDLSDEDVRWAIELSVGKYCSVLAMIRQTAKVTTRWILEPSARAAK